MIGEAHIELIDETEVITGWARSSLADMPTLIRLESSEGLIGEAVASGFRRDLLEAGIGHGHYGFHMKIRQHGQTGRTLIRAIDMRTGKALKIASDRFDLPSPTMAATPLTVDTLIGSAVAWTAADVANHSANLELDRTFQRVGAAIYVDMAFQFALGRWPDGDDRVHCARSLSGQEVSPDELVRILLNSDERQSLQASVPAPYDHRYPFDLT